jgi:hypothetical protein
MQRFGILVWLVAATLGPALSAQAVGLRTGVLTGIARDVVTLEALAGAEIAIGRTALIARTDTAGRFWLVNIPAGHHAVAVRRLGYALASTAIDLSPGDTLDATFGLSAVATRLPEIEITARDPMRLKLAGFEQRRAGGFGHFLGPEAFVNDDMRLTADMLRQFPGTRLVKAFNSSATWLAGGRLARGSTQFSIDRFDRRRGAQQDRDCFATVYLDGAPVFSAMPNEVLFDVNSIAPNTLAAVEYYAGAAQAPPEYPQKRNTCGVLLLWTKL